ncbi:MAG: hypothetical protein WCV58_01450 [Patescibacteria group bacterium]
MNKCPSVDLLIDFVFFEDKLSKDATSEIQEHLKTCIGCKAIVLRYKEEEKLR